LSRVNTYASGARVPVIGLRKIKSVFAAMAPEKRRIKPMNEVFRAAGTKGPHARADGRGGLMARGFYYRRSDNSFAGPFDTEAQAGLVYAIENTRRLHESELTRAELSALRALRRKGIVSHAGLRLVRNQEAA
jgi:hypothetical protein